MRWLGSRVALLAIACGHAPRVLEGEVSQVSANEVTIAGQAVAIPGVLAAQVRVGDRVHADIGQGADGDPQISRLQFLARAAPPAEPDPPGLLPIGAVLPAMQVPAVGGTVPLGAGQGEATVLAFFYTSCGVATACPMVVEKLQELQQAMDGLGRIVTLTLDPDHDSLRALHTYGDAHGADPAVWKLGRLDLAELDPLLTALGVLRTPSDGTIVHSLRLVLLDAQGRLVWRSEGTGWTTEDLITRLRDLGGSPRGEGP